MADWQVVGGQQFRVEADILHWEVKADVAQPELAHIFSVALAVQAVHGYTLLLIATEKLWAFPPESRKFLAQFHREHKAVGVTAFVGVPHAAQLFINLVLRAVGMVSGRRPTTRFFTTRAEARHWLVEQGAVTRQSLLRP